MQAINREVSTPWAFLTTFKLITMYTNKSIRLHNKCLNILDMLQTIGNRIEENKKSIQLYDEKKMDDWLYFVRSRISYVQRLETNQAIEYRLTLYYINTLNEASQVGLTQAAKYLIKS
jgi:hypothetical protein